MFNFPFSRYPYYNYYSYYNKSIVSNIEKQNLKDDYENKIKQESKEKKRSSKYNSFGPVSFVNPFDENFNKNEHVLEILGYKLYLDDIILLGLLFLFYTENVQDDMLFLILILLLLT